MAQRWPSLQPWTNMPDEAMVLQLLWAVHERVRILLNLALILLAAVVIVMIWRLATWILTKMMRWRHGTEPQSPPPPQEAPPQARSPPPTPRMPTATVAELRPRWLDLEPPRQVPAQPRAAQQVEPKAPPPAKAKAAAQPPPQPAAPPAKAAQPQHQPHGRRRPTPEVAWQELAACLDAGHPTWAGRNAHAAYLSCQQCKKHASWRRGAVQTFRQHPGLFDRVHHYWQALCGVPGR